MMDMTMILTRNIKKLKCGKGFTLVEMLVALAITGFMMSAVYGVYMSSLNMSVSEEHRVDIQQNQRFAIDLLMSQLRHAGYDKKESLIPTIVAAGSDYIYFTADFNDDGVLDGPGEHIVFCVYNKTLGFMNGDGTTDSDGDGIPDIGDIDNDSDGFADIGHNHGIVHQPVIAVEEIEFFYTLSSGAPTTFPATPDNVRSVLVSLLVRAEKQDRKYKHTAAMAYTAPRPGATEWKGYTDGRRRRFMSANVNFRNMGL